MTDSKLIRQADLREQWHQVRVLMLKFERGKSSESSESEKKQVLGKGKGERSGETKRDNHKER